MGVRHWTLSSSRRIKKSAQISGLHTFSAFVLHNPYSRRLRNPAISCAYGHLIPCLSFSVKHRCCIEDHSCPSSFGLYDAWIFFSWIDHRPIDLNGSHFQLIILVLIYFWHFSGEDIESDICVAYLKVLCTVYLEAVRKDAKYFGRIVGHGTEIRTHNLSNVKQDY